MITTKEVKINIRSNNISNYLNKGYSCKIGDIINVNMNYYDTKDVVVSGT